MAKTNAVIGALDTKGQEFAFLKAEQSNPNVTLMRTTIEENARSLNHLKDAKHGKN